MPADITALAREEGRAAGTIPQENWGLSRSEWIARFASFPVERQSQLLSEKWGLIRGKEMLPALRKIIEQAPPEKGLGEYYPLNLGDQALQCLLELAPDEGRRVLVHDLTLRAPRFIQLVARFGTPAILDTVREACKGAIRGNELMIYFVRASAEGESGDGGTGSGIVLVVCRRSGRTTLVEAAGSLGERVARANARTQRDCDRGREPQRRA